MYGDYLFERHEYDQAALGKIQITGATCLALTPSVAFVSCQRLEKAMVAYERGLGWRELFALARQTEKSAEDVRDIGRRVGGEIDP